MRSPGIVTAVLSRTVRIGLVAGTILLAGACASGSSTHGNEDRPVTVTVENQNSLDVTIAARESGLERRLGQVSTSRTETFEIPESFSLLELRISASLIGSTNGYVTPPIALVRGADIMLTVAPSVGQSHYTVR